MVRELEAVGVDLVVLDQAIDTTTPSGRLLFHVLAAISEFERDLIRDRVLAGLKRAKAQGTKLGRRRVPVDLSRACVLRSEGLSLRAMAKRLGMSKSTLARSVPQSWLPAAPQTREITTA
jgi:DNA invertase Pin-like site-specific DNA recombinase